MKNHHPLRPKGPPPLRGEARLVFVFILFTLTGCLPQTTATLTTSGDITISVQEKLYDNVLTVLDATLEQGATCAQEGPDVVCDWAVVEPETELHVAVQVTPQTGCRFSGWLEPNSLSPTSYRMVPCKVVRSP